MKLICDIHIYIKVMDVRHLIFFVVPLVCLLSYQTVTRKMKNQWFLNKIIPEWSFYSHNDALKCAIAEQLHRVNKNRGVAQGIRLQAL